MSIPSREEWERMLLKAEKKAKELLAKYEKKCTELQVDNVKFFHKNIVDFLLLNANLWHLPMRLLSLSIFFRNRE